jgi:hypothetical protein
VLYTAWFRIMRAVCWYPVECQTLGDKIQERLNGKSGGDMIKSVLQQQKPGDAVREGKTIP